MKQVFKHKKGWSQNVLCTDISINCLSQTHRNKKKIRKKKWKKGEIHPEKDINICYYVYTFSDKKIV